MVSQIDEAACTLKQLLIQELGAGGLPLALVVVSTRRTGLRH